MLYFTGILSFVPTDKLGFQAISLPFMTDDYIEYLEKEHRKSKRLNLMISFARIMFATANPLFSHLRKRGFHITIWNINSEESADFVHQKLYPNFDAMAVDSPQKMSKIINIL